MQQFRIRCGGRLHRILFDGKHWVIPDCRGTKQEILTALKGSRSVCQAFMYLIKNIPRERRHSPARLWLRDIGIGNNLLIKAVEGWATRGYETSKGRRFVEPEPQTIQRRWVHQIGRLLTKELGIGAFNLERIYLDRNADDPVRQGFLCRDYLSLPQWFQLPITKAVPSHMDKEITLFDKKDRALILHGRSYSGGMCWEELPGPESVIWFGGTHHRIAPPHFSHDSECPLCQKLRRVFRDRDLNLLRATMKEAGYRENSYEYKNLEACLLARKDK